MRKKTWRSFRKKPLRTLREQNNNAYSNKNAPCYINLIPLKQIFFSRKARKEDTQRIAKTLRSLRERS